MFFFFCFFFFPKKLAKLFGLGVGSPFGLGHRPATNSPLKRENEEQAVGTWEGRDGQLGVNGWAKEELIHELLFWRTLCISGDSAPENASPSGTSPAARGPSRALLAATAERERAEARAARADATVLAERADELARSEAEWMARARELEDRVHGLEFEASDREVEIEKLFAERVAVEARAGLLRDENRSLADRLRAAEAECEELRMRWGEAQVAAVTATERCARAEVAREAAAESLDEATRRLQVMSEGQVKPSPGAWVDYKGKVGVLEKRLLAEGERARTLQGTIDELRGKIARQEHVHADLQRAEEALREKLAAAGRREKGLEADLHAARQGLAREAALKDSALLELEGARKEAEDLGVRARRLQAERAELDLKARELKKDKDDLNDRLNSATRSSVVVAKDVRELTGQKEQLQGELEKAQAELKKALEDVPALRNRAEAAEQLAKRLRQETATALEDLANARKEAKK